MPTSCSSLLEGAQTVDKTLFSPRRGRTALSANERIAEFLDFAIQARFAYVNKLSSLLEGAFYAEITSYINKTFLIEGGGTTKS